MDPYKSEESEEHNTKVSTGVTGVLMSKSSLIKAATRLIDIFIDRLDVNVICDNLRKYIYNTFVMHYVPVNMLVVIISEYQMFEVALKLS